VKPLLDVATLLAHRPPVQHADRAAAAAGRARAARRQGGPPPPDAVGMRLGEYVLLAGVPLRYLVPDPALLPDESLRMFHLDPDWIAELLAGILSIGIGLDATGAAPQAQDAAAAALPHVRDVRRGRPRPEPGIAPESGGAPGTGVCGMLLRSALVARYPGLVVSAWTGTVRDDEDPATSPAATALSPLRLERLSSSVLVALWDRAPDGILLQEPPSALRLGLGGTAAGRTVRVRLPDGTEKRPGGTPVDVPVQVDGAGVVDLDLLARDLAAAGHVGDADDGAALAMQLLRPPARRRFRRTVTP
jgi:hypothetical protein